MLDELNAQPDVDFRWRLSWPRIWLMAVARPTAATYRDLRVRASISPRIAYGWLFASSLAGGSLISATAPLGRFEPATGASLALAILVFALANTVMGVIFAGCVHGVVRLFRGSGAYRELLGVFAAFNTPLVVLAGLLALASRSGFVLLGVYGYWLFLYSLAIQAVYRVSRVKATGSVLIALLALGSVLVGMGLALVSW